MNFSIYGLNPIQQDYSDSCHWSHRLGWASELF